MIQGLNSFPSSEGLPSHRAELISVFQSSAIRRIRCFALGPRGTNIEQACQRWVKITSIDDKTTIELGETPEKCLEMARQVQSPDEVAIFWTCAVYFNLFKLFFENPDTLPFFISYVMRLDEMQLATRQDLVGRVQNGQLPKEWKITSHPSPAPLVRNSGCEIVLVTSNAEAAKRCASGIEDACITTEMARGIYGLAKLHSFGSPPMVFFGGITAHGAEVIRKVYNSL